MGLPASRVLLGRLSIVSLGAAAVLAAAAAGTAATRDGASAAETVRALADGCAHCPRDPSFSLLSPGR